MRTIFKNIILSAIGTTLVFSLYAGNEQRAGQAGASELLINPWARSTGWGEANTACVRGLEAQFLNVAGMAFTRKTELMFTRTELMQGSDVSVNAFGFSQKVGETGVLGVSVIAIDFSEIDVTTVFQPDGTGSTYHPQYTNIAVSYAKEFSNSIYGGMTVKIISESIADLTASGVAFDAGVQYVTGKTEQIKFGITMKNVGPTMKYNGDGMSFRGQPSTGVIMTVEQRSQDFELPSLVKIGASYDLDFGLDHKLIVAANFTSNSFTRDQYHGGLQYAYKDLLVLRGGYVYEEGITDDAERATVYTGPTAGVSIQIPLNKEIGSNFSLDYSYRTTNPFNGTHSIGVRIAL